MGQLLLIPDPKPLDERLEKKFFRKAPKRPGVYLMRDAADRVLYVGKARNLQQRLRSYRIANPDRMPRRHLRLLREVARIEFQFCSCESAALKREARLLLSLKPKFNRAGVWPGKTRFIVWRFESGSLQLAVTDVPEPGWRRFGPLGSGSRHLHRALARLLWLVLNPACTCAELPAGWALGNQAILDCRQLQPELSTALDTFFWESSDRFVLWVEERLADRTHPFERTAIEAQLEVLKSFGEKHPRMLRKDLQLGLL